MTTAELDIDFTSGRAGPASPFRVSGDGLSSALLVCRAEPEYPLIYVNRAFLAYVGYTYAEFFEKTGGLYAGIIHPEDRELVQKSVDEAAREQRDFCAEYRVLKKDGGTVWLREVGKKTASKDVHAITVSVCLDMTGEVALREQVKRRGRELQSLMNSLPCGICRVTADEEMAFLYVNTYFYSTWAARPRRQPNWA